MKKFEHYGIEVMKQYVDRPFILQLRDHNIPYTDLPIIKNHVVAYDYDDVRRYALIVPDDESEKVYITTAIPLDMDWDALSYDIDAQDHGAAPAKMKTRLRALLDVAIKNAYQQFPQTGDVFAADYHLITENELAPVVRTELVRLGFDIDDIDKVDSHDVDPVFLAKISGASR